MLIYVFDFVTLLRYDAELYNPIILKVYPLEQGSQTQTGPRAACDTFYSPRAA
jgi:hypothetical protein